MRYDYYSFDIFTRFWYHRLNYSYILIKLASIPVSAMYRFGGRVHCYVPDWRVTSNCNKTVTSIVPFAGAIRKALLKLRRDVTELRFWGPISSLLQAAFSRYHMWYSSKTRRNSEFFFIIYRFLIWIKQCIFILCPHFNCTYTYHLHTVPKGVILELRSIFQTIEIVWVISRIILNDSLKTKF